MKKFISFLAFSSLSLSVLAEPIAFRGVVEGYYGRPWGTEGRLSLLSFMGEQKMNTFIYGPKDDPYHHSKWREPYPAEEMADFAKLLDAAKKNGVKFYWAIHLGGGFRKNNEEDYQSLFQKLNWMYDAGFRAFGVFFDDFGGADAAFHAEICNRVVKDFLEKKGDTEPLIMCPNVYWGSGHPYQKTLGAKLDKRVHVMWTGRSICFDILKDDVKKITADLQRAPFIWWNWPVNDYCRGKLLLGRTYGLDDCEYAGFVTNPMENCEANKIAMYGVAKWALNPSKFDSKKTWEECFDVIYKDKEVARAMRIFAEHNSDQGGNGHLYRREESVSIAPLCATARKEYRDKQTLSPATQKALTAEFEKILKACKVLNRKLSKKRYSLGWEIEGWLDAEIAQMQTGLKTLQLLNTKKNKEGVIASIADIRAKADVKAEAHCKKFAEATFNNDRGHIRKPLVSTLELQPLIEEILTGELKKICKAKTGQDFVPSVGLEAFSTAKSLKNLVAVRDGKYARINRVMEMKEILPDETFGIRVPWQTDYFHAKLGERAAVEAGVIEVSKDGKTWERLYTDNKGEEMQTRLKTSDGWRYARYRNASEKPVSLKINQFKFDIQGAKAPLDELLEACKK